MTTTDLFGAQALVDRYDPAVFDLGRPSARVRLTAGPDEAVDVLLEDHGARLVPVERGQRADAVLSADAATWAAIARDAGRGMEAFRAGRLPLLLAERVAWLGDASAVLLIAIRTYRLIFQPDEFGGKYQIKPVE